MRTPKIQTLYNLIDWLNRTQDSESSIKKIPLNLEPLDSASPPPWGGDAAGFIDGDGHFSVRATAPNKKRNYPIVECRLELVQRQIYHNGISNYSFMLDIATFLETSLKEVRVDSNHPQYRVRTINLASNIKLESYLDKYPLFSSKYLNYKDWLKILEFKKIAKYDSDFIDKVIEIKNGINNKRTIFGRRGSSTRILQGGALKKNKI